MEPTNIDLTELAEPTRHYWFWIIAGVIALIVITYEIFSKPSKDSTNPVLEKTVFTTVSVGFLFLLATFLQATPLAETTPPSADAKAEELREVLEDEYPGLQLSPPGLFGGFSGDLNGWAVTTLAREGEVGLRASETYGTNWTSMGLLVSWDQETQEVTITDPEGEIDVEEYRGSTEAYDALLADLNERYGVVSFTDQYGEPFDPELSAFWNDNSVSNLIVELEDGSHAKVELLYTDGNPTLFTEGSTELELKD